ncbi:hypothetical protein Micbo1qcDRAFT_16312 [Microdochium bolleyi]|uniref:Uncharacterized protein n=1 Tax=Microdochium bolleyi TaxID=196109 RepID=A0A136IVF6_9PEZI|nr:hypothetical protein Micbo1qcDRAFT_16312 [Microdochium bolleyi]
MSLLSCSGSISIFLLCFVILPSCLPILSFAMFFLIPRTLLPAFPMTSPDGLCVQFSLLMFYSTSLACLVSTIFLIHSATSSARARALCLSLMHRNVESRILVLIS